jgi:hypothetical protein
MQDAHDFEMRVFLQLGLANEHVEVFWAGYRNANTFGALRLRCFARLLSYTGRRRRVTKIIILQIKTCLFEV